MTNAVNLAPQPAVKPKTVPQGKNSQPDRMAFGEALQAIRTARRESDEKTPLQPDPHWRAPTKLTLPVGNVERTLSKQPAEFLDDQQDIDEPVEIAGDPEASDATPFPPVPVLTLHHPAFTVRRVSDKPDADPDLPKTKSETAPQAAPVEIEAAPETPAKIAFGNDPAATADPNAAPPDSAPGTTRRPATTGDRPAATEPADTKAAAPRAIVVEQSTSAPAPISTGADLADKLAAQATLISTPAKPEVPAQPAAPPPVQAHSLKLQLHPAELGVVTATLRFAGEQLTIELQVESAQAHQRLSADSETIVKTLRGLGYEIDRVTILQPSVAPPAPSRSDADPSLAGQSRPDPQASDAGGSNNGGDRLARRNSNQGGEGTPNDRSSNAAGPEDRAGGGLYI